MDEKELAELYPYVCDVCGEQATQSAINFYARDNIDTNMREYKPMEGGPKRGCDKHPVYSDTIDLGWNYNPFTGERHEVW